MIGAGRAIPTAGLTVQTAVPSTPIRLKSPGHDKTSRLFIHPANPSGADQAVFAHTMMAPAPSWEEGV